MAAITFPSSPVTGQVYAENNNAWQWDGSAWRVIRDTNQVVQLEFGSIDFNGATLTDALFKNGSLVASPTTLSNPVVTGYIQEQVNGIAGTTPALSPNNGTIQLWTLTGNSTPTSGAWQSGQSLTLIVRASTFGITWTSATFGSGGISWVGGSAPTLSASGATIIELWKTDIQVYGASVGVAA